MRELKHLFHTQRCVLKPMMLLAAMTAVAILSVSILSISTNAVAIYDGDSVQTVYTFSDAPDDILSQAGVKLNGQDDYTFSGIEGGNGEIKLLRAFTVKVTADGKTYKLETSGGTVADALKAAGVKLGTYDMINFSIDDKLTDGMTIAVTNVNYRTEAKTVTLPFGTDLKYDDTLPTGKTMHVDGTPGLMVITYSYRIVNGELVDSRITDETIEIAPVNAVEVIGTKPAVTQKQGTVEVPVQKHDIYDPKNAKYVSALAPETPIELDNNGNPVKYTKKISGKASAYSGGGHTSTGKGVRTGYVAVDPKMIPYGSRLFVRCADGSYIYGYAVAEDTGSFTRTTDRIIDLYFPTEEECVLFGVRYVDIYVLG